MFLEIVLVFRFSVLLVFMGWCFCQGLADGVVVVVGDDAITHSEVLQGAQMLLLQEGKNNFSSEYELTRYYDISLENMVNQRVLFEQARLDTEIVVSGDEVDSYLENHINSLIDQSGSLEGLELALGQSIVSFKRESWDDVYKLMLTERLQQKKLFGLSVSRIEVEDFYLEYRDSLVTLPAKTMYSVISLPYIIGSKSENDVVVFLSSVRDSILDGGDFSFFANKYSQDYGSSSVGGDLGFIQRGTLVPEYEKVAFSLNKNDISLPIKTVFGYHLIQLLDKQGEKVRTRHILRVLNKSIEDDLFTLDSINLILNEIKTNPQLFDSIALKLQQSNNNESGVFGWSFNSDISNNYLSLIDTLGVGEYNSTPLKGEGGYYVLMVHDKELSVFPTLKNSWELLSDFALQKKVSVEMDRWLNVIKKNIYIEYYN